MNSRASSPSLLSTIIQLAAPVDAALPAYAGRAVHAWFLEQVRDQDAALAEALHRPNVPHPFTVSDLWGPGVQLAGNSRRVRSDQPLYLRLTSFEPRLTQCLLNDILPDLKGAMNVAGARLRIERIFTRPEQVRGDKLRSWLGISSYESLIAAYAFRPVVAKQIRLRFESPTVFKSKGSYALFPTPRLVFESLARRWNVYAPVATHPEIVQFAEDHVVVSGYRLRTETVLLGEKKGAMPGFTGVCTFALQHKDAYWLNSLHLLAAFALYAGVGKNTTMGLGQTRRVRV